MVTSPEKKAKSEPSRTENGTSPSIPTPRLFFCAKTENLYVTQLPSTCIIKWKNHFYKMKGDVGMSGHEKERKQEDAYTKIQTHS